MAAPDFVAARRAAGALLDAGVGRVLLFGSLARGEATHTSDVDLVAIYDDLDYAERWTRRCALERRAEAAAKRNVDVYVTDAPEWAVRTTEVPCSLEARISTYAIELADADTHGSIDWDKEIGLPANPAAELASRLTDVSDAVARLTRYLRPGPDEADAKADGDIDELAALEDVRFAAAMGEIQTMVESAAKTVHIVRMGTAPAHSHSIPALLAPQPEHVGETFSTLARGALDLEHLHLWRQGSTYSADRPQARFDEEQLRNGAAAALAIAEFAADQCRGSGIPKATFAQWDRRCGRCRDMLDDALRLASETEFGPD